MHITRRPGKGSNGDPYKITFGPDHSADILCESWWNRNYIIGALTGRTDSKPYTNLTNQNRAMGIFLASNAADKIIFYGSPNASGTGGDKGYTEVTGLCGKRVLIAARDKNAATNYARLYINTRLWNNKVESNGWIFTHIPGPYDEVYAGIRVCRATGAAYSTSSMTGGVALNFTDRTSPVIIEMATASDLPPLMSPVNPFITFQNLCINQWSVSGLLNATSKTLSYTSLAGDAYAFNYDTNTALPKMNGTTANLNPARAYDSPYLTMDHASDQARVSFPGFTDLIFDFDYTKSPAWDDYQTVALWHMDSASAGKTPDDDFEASTRNRDLNLGNGANIAPTSGQFAGALVFDGIDDICTATSNWASYDSVKVDLWFNPARTAGAQVLVTARNTWQVSLGNADVAFTIYDTTGAPRTITLPNAAVANTWQHCSASIDPTGLMILRVGEAAVPAPGLPLRQQPAAIDVGNKFGYARFFAGKIDDLKIRKGVIPIAPPTPTHTPTPTASPSPTRTPTQRPGLGAEDWIGYR